MTWTLPLHARKDIDWAGTILRSGNVSTDDLSTAISIVDNWRATHAFPLNTFQTVLRQRAREVDQHSLVAQRLKRLPSIANKLLIRPSMRLSQMQDIGGCRAVLKTSASAYRLAEIYKNRRQSAQFVSEKDYIASPRSSGYRSIHLVFRYNSGRSEERAVYNGLAVEIQIRSKLQHAWATAVETVGFLTSQALKSSEGEKEWLDFFCLASGLFAYAEGTPPPDNLPGRSELAREVKERAAALRVTQRLNGIRVALKFIEDRRIPNAKYFLLQLDTANESLEIKSYRQNELLKAQADYASIEQEGRASGVDAVLVRSDSASALRRAYPNYFLDTVYFTHRLRELTRSR